ncbi:MAG: 50S ribosomal protein L22 [Candidatus Gottesmanbacteria bacterium]
MTEVSVTSKYLRTSPKKLRLVANMIKGMKPEEALTQLKFLPKAAAKPLASSLKSVLANATNNLKLSADNLKIKIIEINEGPRLKRWRAVSRGTAHQYKHRTSHIKIILEDVTLSVNTINNKEETVKGLDKGEHGTKNKS